MFPFYNEIQNRKVEVSGNRDVREKGKNTVVLVRSMNIMVTLEGKRQFNDDCKANEFLLTSEDTAFQNALVKQCANVLVVGAVPFASFAQTFNRRFGYDGSSKSNENGIQSGPAVKRMKT